jgi:hypothetical protein
MGNLKGKKSTLISIRKENEKRKKRQTYFPKYDIPISRNMTFLFAKNLHCYLPKTCIVIYRLQYYDQFLEFRKIHPRGMPKDYNNSRDKKLIKWCVEQHKNKQKLIPEYITKLEEAGFEWG